MRKYEIGDKVTIKAVDGDGNVFYPDVVVIGVPAGDNSTMYTLTPEVWVDQKQVALYEADIDTILEREAKP